jgi:hypothetical protein
LNYNYSHLESKAINQFRNKKVIHTIKNAYNFFQNPSDESLKNKPIVEFLEIYYIVEFLDNFYPELAEKINSGIIDQDLIQEQLEFMREAFNIFQNEREISTRIHKFVMLTDEGMRKGSKMKAWIQKATLGISSSQVDFWISFSKL